MIRGRVFSRPLIVFFAVLSLLLSSSQVVFARTFIGPSTIIIDGSFSDWGTTSSPTTGVYLQRDFTNFSALDGSGIAGKDDLNYFWNALSTLNGGTNPNSHASPANPIQHVYYRIDTFATTPISPGQIYNIQLNLGVAAAGKADHLLQIWVNDTSTPKVTMVMYSYNTPYPTIGAFTSGTVTGRVSNVFNPYPNYAGAVDAGAIGAYGKYNGTNYGIEVKIPISWFGSSYGGVIKNDGTGSQTYYGTIFTSTGTLGAVGAVKDTISKDVETAVYLVVDMVSGETNYEDLKTINIRASKTEVIYNDVSPTGTASPGDVLLYTVTITNLGPATAKSVVFQDTMTDPFLIWTDNVTTTRGTISKGNAPGDNGCTVDIGNMLVDTSVTITFRATIDPTTPTDTVNKVINQGTVSGSNFASVPTNDPRTLLANDATTTAITRTDMVEPFKTWSLTTDADGNGYPSPGDTITYTTVIENQGNIDALGVVFTDIPDHNTTLMTGSVTTTLGTVTRGNNTGDNGVDVSIGTLPGAYTSATVTFRVIINSPLPPGVTRLTNQGFVSGANFPADPTDDPTDQLYDNPTITPVTAAPFIESYKRYELTGDLNNDGLPGPGDNLTYIITVANQGNQSATGVQFSDHFASENITMVAGSAMTSQGTVATDNATYMDVDIGTMPGGNYTVNISFVVTIKTGAAGGIYNQGDITGTDFVSTKTDDPNTHQVRDATYTALALGPPELRNTKSAILAVDADNDGVPTPGDTLQYIVAINNNGGRAADNITFTDTIDPKTTLVMGSTSVSKPDAVITENPTAVSVYIGTLEAGTSHSICLVTFRVTINNPLDDEVNTISNQGWVSAVDNGPVPPVDIGPLPTDDPNTIGSFGDPTITTAYAHPAVYATKIDYLFADVIGNGIPEPGDTLEYTVNLTNTGTTSATSVIFTDPIIDNLSLTGYLTVPPGSSIISGDHANDPVVEVHIPIIAVGDNLSIIFRATIDNPLPAGVNHVSNQGYISGPTFSAISTDDPRTSLAYDATSTPVTAIPFVEPYKTWALTNDADHNGYPSPGDTLTYSTVIENTGSQDATGVVFNDVPDANSTLIAGSVTTNRGAVTTGNNTGDSMVLVNIDILPGGHTSATVTYQVVINSPLPQGVTLLSNQGYVYGTNFPSDPTDDPTDQDYDNPTVTPLTAVPLIRATKSCELSYDAGNDGPGPGDNLTYIIDIFNNGNQNASGLNFTDIPDANTTLIAGSVTTSQGLVTTGNSTGPPADTSVAVNIGTLLGGGGFATISFTVTVKDIPGLMLISNQGNVSGGNFTPMPTDDPGTTKLDDATETHMAVDLAPSLHITKAAILASDNDHTGLPSPGDFIEYIITINNRGNGPADNITFTDVPDPNTTLIVGSVSATDGIIVSGNTVGDTSVNVNIPVLPGGAAHSVCLVTFKVSINSPFPAGVSSVANLGVVSGDNFDPEQTEDPGINGAPGVPTTTTVYPSPPAPAPVIPEPEPIHDPQVSTTSHSATIVAGSKPWPSELSAAQTTAITGKPVNLPSFKTSNLKIDETQDGYIIYIDVTNTGKAAGTYTVYLRINGYAQDVKSVTLTPSSSERVEWLISSDEPGTYTVEIDGLSGTYYVDGLKSANRWINPDFVLIISMALILGSLLLATIYVWRKRQSPYG